MREPDNWPWAIVKQTFKGVTLKHVYDNLCSYPGTIPCTEGSPEKEIESLYFKWCEAASNIDFKPDPVEFPVLPDVWYDWAHPMTPTEFRQFPL